MKSEKALCVPDSIENLSEQQKFITWNFRPEKVYNCICIKKQFICAHINRFINTYTIINCLRYKKYPLLNFLNFLSNQVLHSCKSFSLKKCVLKIDFSFDTTLSCNEIIILQNECVL